MSSTDARHVLADAMGLPPPPPELGFDALGLDVAWRALAEPSREHAAAAMADERLLRTCAAGTLSILLLWIVVVLYRARSRYRGTDSTPVPLDYRAQQKLAAGKRE